MEDLDAAQLRPVGEEDVRYSPGCIHEYEPTVYASATWELTRETIASERAALAELELDASDEDAYYEMAFERGGFDYGLDFEVGVAAAVAVLNAAGCPTFASCGGHDDGVRSSFPWILFGANASYVPFLKDAATEARCGLSADGRGLVHVYGASPWNTLRFAEALAVKEDRLDALPDTVKRTVGCGGPRW